MTVAALRHRLPTTTRLGMVTLQVADLERSLAFYGSLLGLEVYSQTPKTAVIGAAAGAPLLTLQEYPGARPVPRGGRLGLYHVALLLPTRSDLGGLLRRLGATGVEMGMADHLVSEALYLTDPDGLGVEIYADRPRDTWQWSGAEVVIGTLPLGVKGLLELAADAPYRQMPAGTAVGHIHFYVDDLGKAAAFYEGGLGFDPTSTTFPGARFVAAGGYHHHVGFNTWAAGAPVARADDARLLEWRLELPSKPALERVTTRLRTGAYAVDTFDSEAVTVDPWGTPLRFVVAQPSEEPVS